MAYSYLIFDFGSDEEAAQQARHKVEAWTQGFRLGKKMQLKFEREDSAASEAGNEDGDSAKPAAAKKKSSAKDGEKSSVTSRIRLLLRLDFSDHEKLSLQRWLDRIPAEDPFKSAEAETVRHSDPAFSKTTELFDSLD